jgi:nucleotide-binding universal stress UspA family protein
MKSILVPFYDYYDDDASAAAVTTACHVAKVFGGYLEGLLVIEDGNTTTIGEVDNPEPEQLAGDIESHFRALVAREGISFPRDDVSGPRAAWRETAGVESHVVAEYGRMFDLIVVRRAASHAANSWRQTYEAAIFESGRPVMLAPASPPRPLGSHIMVAWNGSTETARTIALGLPLLAKASTVTVLTVEGGMVAGPSGEDVCAYLLRQGIVATEKYVERDERTIGEAILAAADDLGADLLFKGAYTHTRFRQLIFGGATEDIITQAALPVLMAH